MDARHTHPPGGGRFDGAGDATRRTRLANERTYLAWWRTGLTAFAVSVVITAGIFAIAPLLFLVPLVMQQVANADAASAFTYIATPSTFGFMFAYVLIAAAAPLLVYRASGRVDWRPVLAGLIAAATMIATYVSNITPTPPWPLDMMPYLFAGLMVLGGIVYAAIRSRDPSVTERIGTVEDVADPAHPDTLVTEQQLA